MKADKGISSKAIQIIKTCNTQGEAREKLQAAGLVDGFNFSVWCEFNHLKK